MIKLNPLLLLLPCIICLSNILLSISRNWNFLDNLNIDPFFLLDLAQLLAFESQTGILRSPACITEFMINLWVNKGAVVGTGKGYGMSTTNRVFAVKIGVIDCAVRDWGYGKQSWIKDFSLPNG